MSDRPMRLKYLTKMKIILCIFLLCITAVSVFGEPQELNGIVGESVKFPAAVKIQGSLIHSGVSIGIVTSGRFTAPRDGEYSDRVHWDSSTGLFSLSELRLKDSGIYTVQDTQQTSVSTFNLTVWEGNVPVSKPQVSFTHDEYPCTILCAAARGTEVTLSWYREGQKKPYGSYHVRSAPDLYLPQTVHKGGIYTCEAKNSVSNEKASITVGDHCTAGPSTGTIVAISIAVVVGVIAVVAVPIAVVFALKYRHEQAVLRDVKQLLQKVVLLAKDKENLEVPPIVKQLLQKVVLLAKDKENLEVPPIAVRSLIRVIELLSIGPPHGENSSAFIRYEQGNIEVKPPPPDCTKRKIREQGNIEVKPPPPDCTKRKIRVKDEQPLFRDVWDFIFHRNAPKTEFLLNQATPEVGTA